MPAIFHTALPPGLPGAPSVQEVQEQQAAWHNI